MKKLPFVFTFLLTAFLLTGCLRWATIPTMNLNRFTPQAGNSDLAETGTAPMNPTLAVDSTTQRVLQAYPLWLGSSWIYDYLGFDAEQEVIWRVVDTVVKTQLVENHFVAEVERTVTLLNGKPDKDFLNTPKAGTYWYLIAGEGLYRFDSSPTTDLSTGWLALILPFPAGGDGWYPDPAQRTQEEGSTEGRRSASEPYQQALPMGGDPFTCYNVTTSYAAVVSESTFCDGIGVVYHEFIHSDQALGYRIELIGFSLQ